MTLVSYLNFDGNCREAFEFYARCLGGQVVAMFPFAGSEAAAHVPPEAQNQIMHARLQVGESILMGSDSPGMYSRPMGIHVSVHPTDPAEADRIFAELAAGGEVEMPIQETFWAVRFGMVRDRFGIPWMVNCEAQGAAGGAE